MTLRRFNFMTATTYRDPSAPDPYGAEWAGIGEAIGAEHLNGNVLVLAPGVTSALYHWEASQEEWLLILEGAPALRSPDGEQELHPGDLVAFPVGPNGAHQVINRSDAPARILLLSEVRRPEVIVYPDSGKVMITDPGIDALLRLDGTVGYWEGE